MLPDTTVLRTQSRFEVLLGLLRMAWRGFVDAVMTRFALVSSWLPVLLGAVASVASPEPGRAADAGRSMAMFVGTYTGGESRGIYQARLDLKNGRIRDVRLAAEMSNPSFLVLHPKGRWLYAVSETSTSSASGKPGGEVAAFMVDPGDWSLRLLNTQPSLGAGPCHVGLDGLARRLFVANYSGGTVAAYDIEADGRLGVPWPPAVHHGSGSHPRRQQGPHPHGAYVDPQTGHLLIPDLGLDRVVAYRVDIEKRALQTEPSATLVLPPGAGPRHLAWHPSGRFIYVINELNSSVSLFVRREGALGWRHEGDVTTLPGDFKGESTTAEVAVHPTGKWLYASNRGHDSLAVYDIEPGTGRLNHVRWFPVEGRTPRHFAVTPDGRFLVVAHQDSDSVRSFRVGESGGGLTPAGPEVRISKPVCIVFISE